MAASSTMHFTVLDILLYNLRHVQLSCGSIKSITASKINTAADYVSEAEDRL